MPLNRSNHTRMYLTQKLSGGRTLLLFEQIKITTHHIAPRHCALMDPWWIFAAIIERWWFLSFFSAIGRIIHINHAHFAPIDKKRTAVFSFYAIFLQTDSPPTHFTTHVGTRKWKTMKIGVLIGIEMLYNGCTQC